MSSVSKHLSSPSPRANAQTQAENPPSDSAPRIAAEWARRALDPRGSIKILGSVSTAVGALALQLPVAMGARYRDTESSCLEYRNFGNPNGGDAYAIDSTCEYMKGYLNRIVSHCAAIVMPDSEPHAWTRVFPDWKDPAIYRQAAHATASDLTFEPCIETQLRAENRHQANILLAIFFGILGGGLALVALGAGIRAGVSACNRARLQPPGHDVEAGRGPAPTLPAALEMLPAEPMGHNARLA